MTAFPLREDVYYPESDGQPMAESPDHRREMSYLIDALENLFRDVPNVYVGGNMLFYYVEGDPRTCVAPDVFVANGIPKKKRRVYKVWEEGRGPSLVIEVTSESTRGEDLVRKKALYERLGVEEYFLYDPLDEYLTPPLQGYRLVAGRYQPIHPEPDGSLVSRTAGVTLRPEGERVRLVDTQTGKSLQGYQEVTAASEFAEARADRESAERRAADAKVRALEEELAQLRREAGERRPG
jgi:Uma2 family endonuclease